MTTTNDETTWLSQDAYDRLTSELEELSTTGRADVVAKISAAREEGDLKENGGYHAAKEEQGKIEARIDYLKNLLDTATVGETVTDNGIVELGKVVVAEIAGNEMTFLFGSREIAGDTDYDVFGESSPLGQAVMNKKVGETVSYEAPNGKQITVNIKSAVPFEG